MTPEEIETRITESRQALLKGGNPGTFLVEEEVNELQSVVDEVPDSDPLIPLVPTFNERGDSPFYPIRRVSGYVVYGQAAAALADETLAERAQRFADDLKRWTGTYLPNELAGVYNKLLDQARETGADDPFITGDMRANKLQESGYTTVPGVYAQATLEACAIALGPPEPEADGEDAEDAASDPSPQA